MKLVEKNAAGLCTMSFEVSVALTMYCSYFCRHMPIGETDYCKVPGVMEWGKL
jgi:hypothetical protein